MAVFLLVGLWLGAGFAQSGDGVSAVTVHAAPAGVLGGPAPEEPSGVAALSYADGSMAGMIAGGTSGDVGVASSWYEEGGAVAEMGSAGGGAQRADVSAYKVRRGDTLYGIAKYFGITLETLTSANPGLRSGLLRPGDELRVLPTSGIVYKVNAGDTLESIAERFNVPEESILRFNPSVRIGSLGAGSSLVIPGAASAFAYNAPSAQDFKNRFVKPADGYNWGELHPHNAIDIAGACGAEVVAAAEGLVIPDENFGDGRGGWNGGYGNFVLIEHPFGDGVRTRYAHLKQARAGIGDYVTQGQAIGAMGDTGDATGCHVHFEVYGAANPFAK